MKARIFVKSLLFFLLFNLKASFADFNIFIKNRDKSIDGSRIKQRSIPYRNIKVSGQEEGDVLFFDSTLYDGQGGWRTYSISGLNFVGSWDVLNNSPKIYPDGKYENDQGEVTSAVNGDYFIAASDGLASVDGETSISWLEGDWLIFNGSFWDKISNSGSVARVFGRKGQVKAGRENGKVVFDYDWNQVIVAPEVINSTINKSSIFDIENVETPESISNVEEGSVLKWDAASQVWTISSDEVGIVDKATSEQILDGSIVNEDVSPNAQLRPSKINGLSTLLGKKLDIENGRLAGNLKTNSNLIFTDKPETNDAIINGISLEKLHQDLLAMKQTIAAKESILKSTIDSQATDYLNQEKTFSSLSLDDVVETEESINKFLTNDRVLNTQLSDLDTAEASTSTGPVTFGETLIGAIKRFQLEIIEFSNDQVFGVSDIGGESIELKHLAVDSLGTEAVSTTGDYTPGYLGMAENSWTINAIEGGLVFKGTWDASSGIAPTEATKGDLYIANSTGQFQSVTYRPGDWLVCVHPPSTDPNAPDEEWLKVNNTGSVVGFQGAKDNTPREGSISPEANDYTWEMIGKENAKLNDLTDVDLSLGAGDTLKFVELDRNLDGVIDFRGWTLGRDESGTSEGAIDANRIQESSIRSSSIISSEADGELVAVEKFDGIGTAIDEKLLKEGGALSGNLDVGGFLITIPGTELSGVSLPGIKNKLNGINSLLGSGEGGREDELTLNAGSSPQFFDESKNLVNLNTDAFSEGSANQYFLPSRVYNALLDGPEQPIELNTQPITTSDTIYSAIQKLEAQLKAGAMPEGSLDGARVSEESISLQKLGTFTDNYNPFSLEKLTRSPSDGDTLKLMIHEEDPTKMFWGWESIRGINNRGEWDVVARSAPPTSTPNNGDYYVLTSEGTDSLGNYWTVGDWAIYSSNAGAWKRIQNAGAFKKFNNRDGAVMPEKDDYAFSQLDFSTASIDVFSDVDLSSAPADGAVLKYDGTKWVVGIDQSGVSGTIYTDKIKDGSITPEHFAGAIFETSDFTTDAQALINDHYDETNAADAISTDLDFNNHSIKNCNTINGINFVELYNNCTSFDTSVYQTKLPILTANVESSFLNETGIFSTIDISTVPSGATNFKYDPELMRSFALTETPSVPVSETSPDVEADDTILTAIAKIWKKANVTTLIDRELLFVNSITIDPVTENNGNTYIVESGSVNLPNLSQVDNGFSVTIKSKSESEVTIVANQNFDSSNKSQLILKNKWSSVRLIAGSNKWFLIHKSGVVE